MLSTLIGEAQISTQTDVGELLAMEGNTIQHGLGMIHEAGGSKDIL